MTWSVFIKDIKFNYIQGYSLTSTETFKRQIFVSELQKPDLECLNERHKVPDCEDVVAHEHLHLRHAPQQRVQPCVKLCLKKSIVGKKMKGITFFCHFLITHMNVPIFYIFRKNIKIQSCLKWTIIDYVKDFFVFFSLPVSLELVE